MGERLFGHWCIPQLHGSAADIGKLSCHPILVSDSEAWLCTKGVRINKLDCLKGTS